MKFLWVCLDNKEDDSENGEVDFAGMENVDFSRFAFIRKLSFLEGNDARMRRGRLSLVPAKEAVVDSRLVVRNGTLLSYADIAEHQGKALEEKTIIPTLSKLQQKYLIRCGLQHQESWNMEA